MNLLLIAISIIFCSLLGGLLLSYNKRMKESILTLRHEKEMLAITLNSIEDAVIVTDIHEVVTYLNPIASLLTGWEKEQAIGKPLTEVFNIVHSHTRECVNNPAQKALATGETVELDEYTLLIAKNGAEYQISDSTSPICSSLGDISGVALVFQDVTEQKNTEETLRQSEATVRKKLKSILEPDADIDDLSLSDVIDAETLKSLMEDFYQLTGMLGAIVDTKGNTLVSVGQQDVCSKFHRCHSETQKNCFESDTILSQGAVKGEFKVYHCKNNMWDMATPIIIGDKHLGNVFIGQFFYQDETPDMALFQQQAKKYGFDEQEYIIAVEKVPHFSHEKVSKAMHFYAKLTGIISESSFSAIKQSRLLAEREITLEKLQLSSRVFSDTHEGIIITDPQQIIIDINPAFTQITGYSRKDIIGKTPAVLNSGKQPPQFYAEMWQSITKYGYWQGELWNRTKKDELYAELLTISSLKNSDNKVTNYIGMFSDITSSKHHQDQLNLMAHYDVLTKLPNRALFVDRFNQSIAHSAETGLQLAVCFFDLDNFKAVNDNYGHDIGDRLIIEVATRITNSIREVDTVSRQGGDEFTILLNDIELASQYEGTIERIHQALAAPYFIDNIQHIITASSGVTLYPLDDEDIDTLLRHADHAMYQSKLLGKNRSQLYNPDFEQRIIQKNLKIEEIEDALINKEFQLYYQPKVNMLTGKVFGAEALIRWIHPEKGIIPPLDFLPYINDTLLEIKVGEWVINEALQQLDDWQQQGIKLEISINISSNHLLFPSFVVNLENSLARYASDNAKYLQLEILESSALGDINAINSIVETCQNSLDVSFALDDFGTGYSSLTHLRNLPVNTIKIDRNFVRDILDDPSDYSIVDSVITLTKSFNRNVIAEGVESTNHGLMLLLMGCEQAQGYEIAKPMPASSIFEWLSNYAPNNNWLLFGNKNIDIKESSLEILRLITKQWKDKLERKVLSSPDDIIAWPIIDTRLCHSGNWLRLRNQEQLFEKESIVRLENAYNKVHLITNEIHDQYQQGDIMSAREGLVDLERAFNEVDNSIDACK